VRIEWDANVLNITGTEMVQLLDEAPTRIVLGGSGSRPDDMKSSVRIFGYIMTPDEVKIVADSIYEALTHPPHFENPVVPTGTPASVAGNWAVNIHYLRGTGEQHFVLKQDGNTVTGEHNGELYNATFRGAVHGDQIELISVLPVTGYPITCHFKGKVQGNNMSGTLNMREYGDVTWEAVRA
jgi:hypothetical protein